MILKFKFFRVKFDYHFENLRYNNLRNYDLEIYEL